MPELPEVETVARLIRPSLVGRTLLRTHVSWERTLGGMSKARFARAVRGSVVNGVGRRGKFVVIELARGGAFHGALLVHLRMTGRLHVEPRGADLGPYARVSIDLDDGGQFAFIDVRKFGRMRFVPDPEEALEDLGPEPLGDGFTLPWFRRELGRRRRVLKPLLLDQTFLVGLGNIYVDESLHRAGLHPLTPCDRVSGVKAGRLYTAIRETLAEAIEREGSSFDTFYRTPEGNPGSYQHQFQVYGRGGKPCRRCGRAIQRLVVGQRGTHVCTRCQPKPRAAGRSRPCGFRAGAHISAWRSPTSAGRGLCSRPQ